MFFLYGRGVCYKNLRASLLRFSRSVFRSELAFHFCNKTAKLCGEDHPCHSKPSKEGRCTVVASSSRCCCAFRSRVRSRCVLLPPFLTSPFRAPRPRSPRLETQPSRRSRNPAHLSNRRKHLPSSPLP